MNLQPSFSKHANKLSKTKTINLQEVFLCPWQEFALRQTFDHFAMITGVAVGKTFTGAHFIIKGMIEFPELSSFIGANTYDQLSQVTLREFLYWLDKYGFRYVCDQKPPWLERKQFKDYSNIISVLIGKSTHTIFTRVLSKPNPLRGLEFSRYWLDETRDTPKDTHDVILSRMRESDTVQGLVTTTAAGEDWVWDRFVANRPDATLYGSIHIRTIEAIKYKLITKKFYHTLRASYSPRMAAQELDAIHVNVTEGRCYYAFTERNYEYGYEPNESPLIIGCDFNFSPAPMIWVVGQIGDDDLIHWFDELVAGEIGTHEMARRLGNKYGNWFLRIYGDASGNRGTTSNAGQTDFDQIQGELLRMGVHCSVDAEQYNPSVRDRIENMNRLGCNADNEISMFYDPDRCPHLHQDIGKVIWRHGKPSDGGNCLLTHASDGAGYAAMKVSPPLIGSGLYRIGQSVPARRLG